MVMSESIEEVMRRLKRGLLDLYGPRLEGVYLFGSVARGEADAESDIDVLIVLDRVENYSAEIERTSELIGTLSLECGRSISRVILPAQQWREGESMFLLNAREEAVAV